MPGGTLRLTKHHGAGNDFLVLLDEGDEHHLDAPTVRLLCDRRRGIGADGLLRAGRGQGVLTMALVNADGSPAEMSGNGIRCLVQAAVLAGWAAPGRVEVDTAAGRRSVEYRDTATPGLGSARVAMGRPVLGAAVAAESLPGYAALAGADAPSWLGPARHVDMGNPHVVLFAAAPVSRSLVRALGAAVETATPGGTNVEFVWPGPEPGAFTLRVWERGAGETLACGTGTCAAVAAAADAGLGAGRALVHNPGGDLEVELADDGTAVLGGPTQLVGAVEIDERVLSAALAAAAGGVGGDVDAALSVVRSS